METPTKNELPNTQVSGENVGGGAIGRTTGEVLSRGIASASISGCTCGKLSNTRGPHKATCALRGVAKGSVVEKAALAPVEEIDPAIIQETISAVLEVVNSGLRDTAKEILTVAKIPQEQAAVAVSRIGVSTTSQLAIGKLTGVVAKQYSVAGKHTPLILLCALSTGVLVKNVMGFSELKKIVKAQNITPNAKPA